MLPLLFPVDMAPPQANRKTQEVGLQRSVPKDESKLAIYTGRVPSTDH